MSRHDMNGPARAPVCKTTRLCRPGRQCRLATVLTLPFDDSGLRRVEPLITDLCALSFGLCQSLSFLSVERLVDGVQVSSRAGVDDVGAGGLAGVRHAVELDVDENLADGVGAARDRAQ